MNIVAERVMKMSEHEKWCDCETCQHRERIADFELEYADDEEQDEWYRFDYETGEFSPA